MTQSIDELCPAYIGEDRITVTCDTTQNLSAFQPIQVDFSYERCKPEGVMLPLELVIQGPSQGSYRRYVYTRTAPDAQIFKPREGGQHLVRIAELGHNGWWGGIVIDIQGEKLQA